MSEQLTNRELEIAILVADGLSNKVIGEILAISERTARTHVSNILAKLELSRRSQIALWAVDNGYAAPQIETQESELHPLSERENEIATWIAKGLSNQQIADALIISERTVRCHISAILSKLGVYNRTEVAMLYAV